MRERAKAKNFSNILCVVAEYKVPVMTNIDHLFLLRTRALE